jgi:hypothetical protein
MKLKKIVLLAIPFFLFSCVIQQDIYFNKDFSGSYKYSFDFKEYNEYMNIETDEEDDEDNNLSNEDFEEYLNFVKSGLSNVYGIENLKIVNNADQGEVYFSFDFADIESLNEALKYANLMESETNEFSSYFEKKGKTITYLRPELPEVKEDNNEEEFEEEDFDYANLFVWRFNIEFEAEVKNHNLAKDTTISIQKAGRKFTETNNIFDYTKKETKWVFKMK